MARLWAAPGATMPPALPVPLGTVPPLGTWRALQVGVLGVGPSAASFLFITAGVRAWGWQGVLLVSHHRAALAAAVHRSHWYCTFENWHVAYFLFGWVIERVSFSCHLILYVCRGNFQKFSP